MRETTGIPISGSIDLNIHVKTVRQNRYGMTFVDFDLLSENDETALRKSPYDMDDRYGSGQYSAVIRDSWEGPHPQRGETLCCSFVLSITGTNNRRFGNMLSAEARIR